VKSRERLEEWTHRPKTAQALAQRARIVLACAAGNSNTVVAHQLRITKLSANGASALWSGGARGAAQSG
jgi:hypothetical protein